MPISTSDLKARLTERALAEGFSALRICGPDDIPQVPARYGEFLDAGRHGQMGWMAQRVHWRTSPAALWPAARSLIMLAETYTPAEDPLEATRHPDRGAISVYARNGDYHDLVKKRLKRLARWLVAQTAAQVKVFVDTAPVAEKPLAEAAGLGWLGKHTNLVSRELGSWFFLGSIFTTLDLPKDEAEVDRCGSCTRCQTACPTDAFPRPYQLDARRCISYLTIEHAGPVDPDLRALMGNRIYGCDDCLAVCPWNKFAAQAREMRYAARPELVSPRLEELAALDDAAFRALFSASPIKRIGRNRFVRNVLYAIGNSGDRRLRAAARARLDDGDATVAEAAQWALDRLATGEG